MQNETPAIPSRLRMMQLCGGHWVSQCLSVVAQLGVADELADGPRPIGEIAKAVEAHEDSLYRVMRALADLEVFEELEDRRFALTDLSQHLRTGVEGTLRHWAIVHGLPPWRQMWTDLIGTVRTGTPACERVLNKGPFEILSDNPEWGRIFNAAMKEVSSGFTAAVLAAYDFSPFKTVVDVGGGNGALISAVLAKNPEVRGILFDLPNVVESAPSTLEEAGVADRCEIVGGSFFDSVPSGGDAYILSHVIHDWNDEKAAQILGNIRKAINEDGRLLLVEDVLPDKVEPSHAKAIDLEMLQIGGRERTGKEFAKLFESTRFELFRSVPSGPFSIVEAVPR